MSRVKDSEPMSYEQEMVCGFFRTMSDTLHDDAFVDKDGEVLTTTSLEVIAKLADVSDSPQTVHFLYVSESRGPIHKEMALPLPNFSEYLKGEGASMEGLRVVLNEKKNTLTFVSEMEILHEAPEFYSSVYKDVETILRAIQEKGVAFTAAPAPSAPDEKDLKETMVSGRRGLAVAPPPPPPSWRDRAIEGPAVGGVGLGK